MNTKQAVQLGSVMRSAREQRGISLSALASQLGVDKGWLSRFEMGLYREPRATVITALVEALELDSAEIDDVTGNYVSRLLPGTRTYFRATTDLSAEAIDEIEAAIADIRRAHSNKMGTLPEDAGV